MSQMVVTYNETRKGLLIMWDYRFSMLMEFFMIGMIFSGVMLFIGQGELKPEQLTSALLGFLITFYVMETISRMSYALTAEAQAGTLEQMYMSPVSSVFFLFGRALSSFAMASVSLMIMVPVLMLLFNIRFDLPLAGVVIIVITLIGVAGFGLMIAGMTIVFKQTGPVANMMSNMMLFINGTFLPVDQMPKWLESLAMILPSTQGIIALREVSLNSKTLTELWSDGTLVYLTAHSSICLIVGWMIFVWCERVARRQGSLGQY